MKHLQPPSPGTIWQEGKFPAFRSKLTSALTWLLHHKSDHIIHLVKILQWLPISFRGKINILKMVYKALLGLPPAPPLWPHLLLPSLSLSPQQPPWPLRYSSNAPGMLPQDPLPGMLLSYTYIALNLLQVFAEMSPPHEPSWSYLKLKPSSHSLQHSYTPFCFIFLHRPCHQLTQHINRLVSCLSSPSRMEVPRKQLFVSVLFAVEPSGCRTMPNI